MNVQELNIEELENRFEMTAATEIVCPRGGEDMPPIVIIR